MHYYPKVPGIETCASFPADPSGTQLALCAPTEQLGEIQEVQASANAEELKATVDKFVAEGHLVRMEAAAPDGKAEPLQECPSLRSLTQA